MEKITATIKGASSLEATLTPERGDITCTLEKSAAVKLEKREVIPSIGRSAARYPGRRIRRP